MNKYLIIVISTSTLTFLSILIRPQFICCNINYLGFPLRYLTVIIPDIVFGNNLPSRYTEINWILLVVDFIFWLYIISVMYLIISKFGGGKA